MTDTIKAAACHGSLEQQAQLSRLVAAKLAAQTVHMLADSIYDGQPCRFVLTFSLQRT